MPFPDLCSNCSSAAVRVSSNSGCLEVLPATLGRTERLMWVDMGQDSLDPTILSTFSNLNQCTIQFGGNGGMTQIRLYGFRHHCQSERYPTMLFSQSYISPILGYYRNKTITSTKSHMVKSEPSVIPNMTNGDSSRVIPTKDAARSDAAGSACNDGGNRHAQLPLPTTWEL